VKTALRTTEAAAAGAARIRSIGGVGGATIWHVEDYTVPLIALEIAFPGGAAQEPDDAHGGANMLADLLTEGAGDLDAAAFQQRLEERAIELSASSGREALRVSMRTLAKNAEEAFAMLGLALREPRLDADAIERVRAQVLASIRRDEFDPDSIAGRRWFALAFPDHPYGREDRGSVRSVSDIDHARLDALRTRLLTRDGVKIAVVGAIAPDALERLLSNALGGLPASGGLLPVRDAAPAALGSRHVIDLDVPQSTIRFGAPGPRRKDPDFMAQFVVNHILGGGTFQSRLFREVREKRGLAYSVSSTLYSLPRAGVIFGGTATKNERAKESLDVIEAEIANLAAEGPSAEELDRAKSYLTGSYALRFDTSGKIANQLVQIQLDDLGRDYIDRRNAEVEAVDLAAAKAAAERLLGPRKLLVTVVGRPVDV
jgi:zinc protease